MRQSDGPRLALCHKKLLCLQQRSNLRPWHREAGLVWTLHEAQTNLLSSVHMRRWLMITPVAPGSKYVQEIKAVLHGYLSKLKGGEGQRSELRCIQTEQEGWNNLPYIGRRCERRKWPAPLCPAAWPGSSRMSRCHDLASTDHTWSAGIGEKR